MSDLINRKNGENGLEKLTDPQLRELLFACADQIQKSMAQNNEIEKVFNRTFVIKLNDINQIYRIVDQRINNDRDKIDFCAFSISVTSTEDNFRKYNNIETFLSDIETRDIKPTSIQMSWAVNIKFPGEDHFLPQKISIVISRPEYEQFEEYDEKEFVLIYKNKPIIGSGAIIVSVENTNKIWALDMLSHIENWIEKNVKKPMIDASLEKIYKNRNLIKSITKAALDIFPVIIFVYISIRSFFVVDIEKNGYKQILFIIAAGSVLILYNYVIKKAANWIASNLSKKMAGLYPQSAFIFSVEDQEKYDIYLSGLINKGKTIVRNIYIPIILNLFSSAIYVLIFEQIIKKILGTN